MKNLKVASVQFCSLPNNKAGNFEIISSFVEKAADSGVELIAFPEMCITGYWYLRDFEFEAISKMSESISSGNSSEYLLRLAKKFNLSIGAGLIEISDEGKLYNTYVVAMPNGEIASYRKLHCFVNPHMSSGEDYKVFELPSGQKIGILICYDNNLVENVRNTALMGADVIIAPHQTGGCSSEDPNIMGVINSEIWEKRNSDPESIENEFKGPKGRGWLMRWLPARAHDNGVFYVFSNGVGPDDNEIRTGNAMIIDPYGRILSETWKAENEMVIADLEGRLRKENTGQRWITARRPELYKPLSIPTGKEVDIRTARFSGKGC